MKRTIAIVTIISILIISCASAPDEPIKKDAVTIQLNWLHFASYGGLYAADQKGYYADEGLEVTIVEGGPTIDYISPVIDQTAEFGVAGADALILARSEDKTVKAIGSILQISPIAIVATTGTNIQQPSDLIGKTIRMTPQIAPSFRAMMSKLDISPDQYTEVVLPSDPTLFPSDDVPAWGVYLNSFAVTLSNMGHDLNYILPQDYGVRFYSDTLFTSEQMIEQDPELVTRFLRATLKGYQYAIENPDEIGQLVAKYDPEADIDVQTDMMIATTPLIHTGKTELGWMVADVWREMYEILLEQEIISNAFDITDTYTMTFLEEIYGDLP